MCYTVPLAAAVTTTLIWRKNRSAQTWWLSLMFYGGSLFGIIDHLWNGELFLISKDLPKDLALGAVITIAIFLGWKIIVSRVKMSVAAALLIGLAGAFTGGDIFAMDDQIVVLDTNQGAIEIKLMPETAPKACENFTKLAEKGYYNGIIFHRVIKGFMIQGGDPTGTGRGGESIWGKPFEDEIDPKVQFDSPGILAMANSGPKTNGSQFFITTAATPWLNGKHTIFGKVVSGYDVVEKIENSPTGAGDKPKAEQKIIKAYLKTGK